MKGTSPLGLIIVRWPKLVAPLKQSKQPRQLTQYHYYEQSLKGSILLATKYSLAWQNALDYSLKSTSTHILSLNSHNSAASICIPT